MIVYEHKKKHYSLIFVESNFTYVYIYDSQIMNHNPCFNLLILHNNSFDNVFYIPYIIYFILYIYIYFTYIYIYTLHLCKITYVNFYVKLYVNFTYILYILYMYVYIYIYFIHILYLYIYIYFIYIIYLYLIVYIMN